MTNANWKVKTPRDKKFLLWLLTQECELRGRGPCMGQKIYHHTSTGGTSLKGSDYDAICVCFQHHTVFDNAGKKGNGIFRDGQLEAIIARNKIKYEAQTGRKILDNSKK